MEKYYYSNKENGFYTQSIHGINRPNDCVEINKSKYLELLNKPSDTFIYVDGLNVSIEKMVLTRSILEDRLLNKLSFECDGLQAKLHKNESYKYDIENYQKIHDEVLSLLSEKRKIIAEISLKTVGELTALLAD